VLANSGISISGTQENPSVGLTYGVNTGIAFAAFYSGLTAHTSILAGTNTFKVSSNELAGNFTAVFTQQNSASSGTFTMACSAAADDVAFSAVGVGERDVTNLNSLAAQGVGEGVFYRSMGLRQSNAVTIAAPQVAKSGFKLNLQAVAGQLQVAASLLKNAWVFILGGFRAMPPLMWGRIGSMPQTAPGPQLYLQSLSATELSAIRLNKLSFLLMTSADALAGGVFKGLYNTAASTAALSSVVYKGVSSRLLVASSLTAELRNKVGKLIDGAASLAAQFAKSISKRVLSEALLTPALNMTRGLVQMAVRSTAQLVVAATVQVNYVRALLAEALTSPALNKLMILFRTLGATTIGQAVITKVSTAAQTLQQAMVAAVIGATSLVRLVTKPLSAGAIETSVLSQARGLVQRAITATTEGAASLLKMLRRVMSAEALLTPTLNKLMSLFRTLNPEAIFVAAVGRASSVAQTFQQAVAATVVGLTSVTRLITSRLRAEALLTASVTQLRGLVQRTITATAELAANIARSMRRSMSVGGVMTPALVKVASFFRSINATAILAVAISKAAFVTQAYQQALAATLETVATVTKLLLRVLATTTALTASVNRRVGKLVNGVTAGVVALTQRLTFARSLAASAAEIAVLNKLMSLRRALASTAAEATDIVKLVSRRLSAQLAVVAAFTKTVGKVIAAVMVAVAVLVKRLSLVRLLSADGALVAALNKRMELFRTLAATALATPVVFKTLGIEILAGIHLAYNRMSQTVRGAFGRTRKSTSTSNRNVDTIKPSGKPITGNKPSGSNDTEIS
jgi:hypothetical protein